MIVFGATDALWEFLFEHLLRIHIRCEDDVWFAVSEKLPIMQRRKLLRTHSLVPPMDSS